MLAAASSASRRRLGRRPYRHRQDSAGAAHRAAGRRRRFMPQHTRVRRLTSRFTVGQRRAPLLAGLAAAALAVPGLAVPGLAVPGGAVPGLSGPGPALARSPSAATATATVPAARSCHLGNGVKHVVEIGFDNIHFFRDNPNVPSDLQMMPHLLHFLEDSGTFLSNNHTPLIAHTADDLLTTLTGLYGDRQGMPISNSYRTFNPDGTTDPAGSFAYWTDPVFHTAATPRPGHATTPSMV